MYRNMIATMTLLALSAAPVPAADFPVLTDSAYGAVIFGSRLDTVEKKLGETAKWDNGDKECDFVRFDQLPGMYFMVEKGIVTRGDTESPQVKNRLGIRLGMSLEEVRRRYPQVVVEPHKYDEKGHYLIFYSKDRRRAILFEESGGRITQCRAGIEPSVEYVEGCK